GKELLFKRQRANSDHPRRVAARNGEVKHAEPFAESKTHGLAEWGSMKMGQVGEGRRAAMAPRGVSNAHGRDIVPSRSPEGLALPLAPAGGTHGFFVGSSI